MKSHSPKKMQLLNPVISPDLCLSQQLMKTCRTLVLHQPPQYCRTGFSPIRIPTAHKAPPRVLPSRLRGCTMAGGINGNVRGNLLPLTKLFTTSHRQSIIVSPKTNSSFIGYVSGSSIPDMSHASSSFQSLFDAALKDYTTQTGTRLDEHPFATQFETCGSVESISSVLQEHARAFREFRGEDEKVMKSLKSTVHILYKLSISAFLFLGERIGLVCTKPLIASVWP